MREDYLDARARQGSARRPGPQPSRGARTRCCPSTALIAINFGFVLSGAIAVETVFSWPGLGLLTYEALSGPDLPMLQGLFLVFSAAVIFFNLVAELAVSVPRPAGAAPMSTIAWQRSRTQRSPGPDAGRSTAAVARAIGAALPGMVGLVVLFVIVAMALSRSADRRPRSS